MYISESSSLLSRGSLEGECFKTFKMAVIYMAVIYIYYIYIYTQLCTTILFETAKVLHIEYSCVCDMPKWHTVTQCNTSRSQFLGRPQVVKQITSISIESGDPGDPGDPADPARWDRGLEWKLRGCLDGQTSAGPIFHAVNRLAILAMSLRKSPLLICKGFLICQQVGWKKYIYIYIIYIYIWI